MPENRITELCFIKKNNALRISIEGPDIQSEVDALEAKGYRHVCFFRYLVHYYYIRWFGRGIVSRVWTPEAGWQDESGKPAEPQEL